VPRLRKPPGDGDGEVIQHHSIAEPTAPKQRGIPFKAGESGNPNGRPKGSRNRLGETFLNDLVEVWHTKGPQALQIVAATEPVAFTKLVASILPREVVSLAMSVNANVNVDLSQKAASFLQVWNGWRERNGEPADLELTAEAETSYKIDGDD
jgi:hypothetical protein